MQALRVFTIFSSKFRSLACSVVCLFIALAACSEPLKAQYSVDMQVTPSSIVGGNGGVAVTMTISPPVHDVSSIVLAPDEAGHTGCPTLDLQFDGSCVYAVFGSNSVVLEPGQSTASITSENTGVVSQATTVTIRPIAISINGSDVFHLYYYRARYYHQSIGRFLSEDPSGFNGGYPNLYRYVFNKPGNLTDPYGKQTNSVDS